MPVDFWKGLSKPFKNMVESAAILNKNEITIPPHSELAEPKRKKAPQPAEIPKFVGKPIPWKPSI